MNKSGGQTAHTLAFGSVTRRPGGKFKDPVLVGATQPRSFRSLFFCFFLPQSVSLSLFSPLLFSPPLLPALLMFLISFPLPPFLCKHGTTTHSLLLLSLQRAMGEKKKPINISCRPSLSPLSSLRRYLNATRGRFFHSTWLLSPLPPSPFPTMDLRRSCLFTFSF